VAGSRPGRGAPSCRASVRQGGAGVRGRFPGSLGSSARQHAAGSPAGRCARKPVVEASAPPRVTCEHPQRPPAGVRRRRAKIRRAAHAARSYTGPRVSTACSTPSKLDQCRPFGPPPVPAGDRCYVGGGQLPPVCPWQPSIGAWVAEASGSAGGHLKFLSTSGFRRRKHSLRAALGHQPGEPPGRSTAPRPRINASVADAQGLGSPSGNRSYYLRTWSRTPTGGSKYLGGFDVVPGRAPGRSFTPRGLRVLAYNSSGNLGDQRIWRARLGQRVPEPDRPWWGFRRLEGRKKHERPLRCRPRTWPTITGSTITAAPTQRVRRPAGGRFNLDGDYLDGAKRPATSAAPTAATAANPSAPRLRCRCRPPADGTSSISATFVDARPGA